MKKLHTTLQLCNVPLGHFGQSVFYRIMRVNVATTSGLLNSGAVHILLLLLDVTELIIIEELCICSVAYSQYTSHVGFTCGIYLVSWY